MVMEKTAATSAIAKQKKMTRTIENSGQIRSSESYGQNQKNWNEPVQQRKPEPTIIVHDVGNPNQVLESLKCFKKKKEMNYN